MILICSRPRAPSQSIIILSRNLWVGKFAIKPAAKRKKKIIVDWIQSSTNQNVKRKNCLLLLTLFSHSNDDVGSNENVTISINQLSSCCCSGGKRIWATNNEDDTACHGKETYESVVFTFDSHFSAGTEQTTDTTSPPRCRNMEAVNWCAKWAHSFPTESDSGKRRKMKLCWRSTATLNKRQQEFNMKFNFVILFNKVLTQQYE